MQSSKLDGDLGPFCWRELYSGHPTPTAGLGEFLLLVLIALERTVSDGSLVCSQEELLQTCLVYE